MNLYHERSDVRSFLEKFANHQVYFYMKDKYYQITNIGDKDEGIEGQGYQDKVTELAAEKFSMSTEMVDSIFDKLDIKAREFMLKNK